MLRTTAHRPVTPLDEVRQRLDERDAGGAMALLRALPTDQRAHPAAQVCLAWAQFLRGRDRKALKTLLAARAAGANTLWSQQLQALIQDRLGDPVGGAATRAALLERFPASADARYRLAMHHLRDGDLASADACAAAMPETALGTKLRLSLRYQIAVHRLDLPEIARVIHRCTVECDTCPALPELKLVLAELAPDVRRDLTDRLIGRWPDLAARLRGGEAALDLAKLPGGAPEQALLLALTGRPEEARRLLDVQRSGDKPALDDTAALLQAMPPDGALLRPLIVDDGAEVIVSPPGTTGTTVLVFTGLNGGAMVPIVYVDRLCAAAGHAAIYLRDPRRTFYLGGVSGLSGDLEGSIAALRGLLQELQTSRLRCMGSSAGGFAAIRYGLRLGAEKVLCASSPTTGNTGFLSAIGEGRARLLVHRMLSQFPQAALDLRDELQVHGHRCRVDLWFGADCPMDAAHASHLAGYPGVHLRPIAGLERHESFASIVALGGWREFLA